MARWKIHSPIISTAVTARPRIKFHCQRLCLDWLEASAEISLASKPACKIAARTAETFFPSAEFQRTLARSAATLTETLWTPGIFCAASVTLRAQLLHVMPVTRSSVVVVEVIEIGRTSCRERE